MLKRLEPFLYHVLLYQIWQKIYELSTRMIQKVLLLALYLETQKRYLPPKWPREILERHVNVYFSDIISYAFHIVTFYAYSPWMRQATTLKISAACDM